MYKIQKHLFLRTSDGISTEWQNIWVDAFTGTSEIEGGMGAIPTHIGKNGVFHALSHASKQLIKHEKNSSPYLLEMDVVVWAMEYYQ